jgi:hypothetical protein
MKILTVVARYNENLSWVKNLNTDVIIYNKGEDTEIPNIKVENYGRESETFVRFILDWYDKIQEYDSVAFLQGNPFDHIHNPLDLIHNASSNQLIAISKYSSKINLNKSNQLKSINDYALSRVLGYECEIDTSYLSPRYDKFTRDMETSYASMILELCGIMEIKNVECIWAAGAQYLVPTHLITNKKFDWWLDLHTLHKIYEDNLKDTKSLPHILERMWPMIWMHSTN